MTNDPAFLSICPSAGPLIDWRHDEETAACRGSSAEVLEIGTPVVGGRRGDPSSMREHYGLAWPKSVFEEVALKPPPGDLIRGLEPGVKRSARLP